MTAISAQSVPQAFRYQAVLRDLDDNIITNQQVGILLSLIQDSVVYQEAHTVSTNSIGLMVLNIGGGNALLGEFSTIDWGQTTSLGIALDPAGGDQYEDLGFVDLLSVPYALWRGNKPNFSKLFGRKRK